MPSRDYNPYNFVRLPEGGPERRRYPGIDRTAPDAYSGVLACELTILTRLFTADHRRAGVDRTLPFLKNGEGKPILQGTSLKGMIRSVYEAAFPSCLPLAATMGPSKKVMMGEDGHPKTITVKYRWDLRPDFDHSSCDSIENLCPACRLFGTIYKDQVHAQGRIAFSDATLSKGALRQEIIPLQELSTPKPHSVIYGRDGAIRGRKFYYHHDPVSQEGSQGPRKRASTITEFATPGQTFAFTIDFLNLSRNELRQLIACLLLDGDHAHKLGMAKPLGYGSCRIAIRSEGSTVEQGEERYRSWTQDKTAFDEFAWKLEEGWLQGDLEKLLRRPRPGSGTTGYPKLNEYTDLDIDEEGQYVSLSQPATQREAEPVHEPLQANLTSSEVIAAVLERAQHSAPPPPPSATVRRSRGDKSTFIVIKIERDEFLLRDPETGQEDIPLPKRGPSREVGDPVKVKILEVTKDGRVKKVQTI